MREESLRQGVCRMRTVPKIRYAPFLCQIAPEGRRGSALRGQLAGHQEDDNDLRRKVVHLPKLVLTHEAHCKTL